MGDTTAAVTTTAPQAGGGLAAARRMGAVVVEWAARSEADRPLVPMVAAPLAMTAAVLSGAAMLVPPIAAVQWRCCPANGRLTHFLLGFQTGLVSVLWASVGVALLADYPDRPAVAAAIWIGAALALAIASVASRHKGTNSQTHRSVGP